MTEPNDSSEIRTLRFEVELARKQIEKAFERMNAISARIDLAAAKYKQHESELRAINEICTLWESRLSRLEGQQMRDAPAPQRVPDPTCKDEGGNNEDSNNVN